MPDQDLVSLQVERLNQAVQLLTEQYAAIKQERHQLLEVTETILGHLEMMKTHVDSTERLTAATARMEAEFRETVAEAHKLVDKMPGKRHY